MCAYGHCVRMGLEHEIRSQETQDATPEAGRDYEQVRAPVIEQVMIRRLLSGAEEYRENPFSQAKLPRLQETVDVQGKMPYAIQVRDPEKPNSESTQRVRDYAAGEVHDAVTRASPTLSHALAR